MQVIFVKFSRQISVKFSMRYRQVFRFSRFSARLSALFQFSQIFQSIQFFQIFRSCTGSADFPDFLYCGNFPQIFRVKFFRFSASPPSFPMFGIFQMFKRYFPRQVFRMDPDFPLARFSASPPASQVFRTKKRTGNFPVLSDHFGYTLKAIYPFMVLSAMFTAI